MQNMTLLERIARLDENPKIQIKCLEEALNGHNDIESFDVATLFFLLGRGYLLTGKQDAAIHILNKALSYFIEFGDKMALYQCYNNLGIVYREEKQYDLALKALNNSYNISYDLEDFSFVILSLVNLGSVYSSIGNLSKSFEYLNKALEYKGHLKNSKVLGDLYNNYAYMLMEIKNYDEALEYLFLAYEAYKKVYGETVQTSVVIVLSNIGEVYLYLGAYDDAEKYITKALNYSEDQEIRFIEMDCHLNLSKLYEAQGDYKEALLHHKKYMTLKESIFTEKTHEEIQALKIQIENESKKSEEEINVLRNVELKNKTTELEKTLKNLSQITTIGQNLTSSMDMDQIFDILRKSIYALMSVHVFGLALYDDQKEKIIYKYFEEKGKPLELMIIDLNDRVSLASYCILHEEDLFIHSFYDEYEKYVSTPDYLSIGSDKTETTRCIIYCRLISEEKCIGLITMQNYRANEYTEVDFEMIKALASYVAIAISNAQKRNIIMEKASELEYLSYNDPLTGLYNRRYFNLMMETCKEDEKLPMGLIVGDMNNLKLINDSYGHLVGDQYLVKISEIMKQHARNGTVFRLGGDEFAILIFNTSNDELIQMIHEIERACHLQQFGPKPISIALGYTLKVHIDEKMDDIFSIAESKMYEVKNGYHRANRYLK